MYKVNLQRLEVLDEAALQVARARRLDGSVDICIYMYVYIYMYICIYEIEMNKVDLQRLEVLDQAALAGSPSATS